MLRAAEQLQAPASAGAYSDATPTGNSLIATIPAAFNELRRRWKLASVAFVLVFSPVLAYALLAVPQYTSRGVLQVSAQGGLASANPLMELAAGGGSTQVNTEVQIITRSEFLATVFKGLRLHVVDPHQPTKISTEISVSVGGESPVDGRLRRLRSSLRQATVVPERFTPLPIRVEMGDGEAFTVTVDPKSEDPKTFSGTIGSTLELGDAQLEFASAPLEAGEAFDVVLLSDGLLLDRLVPRLTVAALGTSREPTNLVRISFMHPDRHTARAVVQGIMDQYMVQSLNWQTQGASQSVEFVRERLQDVRADLSAKENALSAFAEEEHAVQLDTQARVTIENSAELESARLRLDLDSHVLGNLTRQLRGAAARGTGNADLTASLIDDPVLSSAIGALTEAETRYETMKATFTAEHPKLREAEARIGQQQKTVGKLVRTARKNIGSKKSEIDRRLAETNAALASYPEKELQLARLMRDVEVSQRLYAFLLEKAQEAEILEASTTTDKRTVDNGSLPHKRAAPNRSKLLATGAAFAFVFAFATVYLARIFQRRVATVEAAQEIVPYPMYGSIPFVVDATGRDRLALGEVWTEGYSPVGEAFRALCVSLTLTPVREAGRGRIILMTSSFAGEGKSTVGANVAVSLARSGSRVLLVDLDLRRPVQHRIWKVRRAPGYADLMADASPIDTGTASTTCEKWGVDVIPAGTRLPDTLGALLSPRLVTLLEDAVSRYDYVIVDGAPMFVGDAPVLASLADLVLLVVRPGLVERRRLAESVAELSRMDTAKGVVFNGVSRSNSDYYYYSSDYRYAEAPAAPGDEEAEGAEEDAPPHRAAS